MKKRKNTSTLQNNFQNLFLFFTILIISCCSSEKIQTSNKSTQYFYVNYNLGKYSELYLDTTKVVYQSSTLDSIHTLIYESNVDTLVYKVKKSKNFQPEYFSREKLLNKSCFVYVSSKNFQIDGQVFYVYKYAYNPEGIDGCSTHFWSPDLGIFLKRFPTWRNFSKLQTNNTGINNQINLLAELIYQDTQFYQGCAEEVEIIPKSIVEEFFKWKLNNK